MEADCLEYQRVTQNRVPMGNRLCTPGFLGLHCTPFPYKSHMLKRLQQIPGIQWVAWRTVPVIGAVAGAGAVPHGWHTIPVAIRWPIIPIPLHMGDRQTPETYRFRCNQGQKGSVMHRFRGYRGKLDTKKIQTPPRLPRLRGCTRPIVNSWVKFFPWGTGVGRGFWQEVVVKQNRHAAIPRAGYNSGLFQPHLVCTLSPTCQAKSTRGRSTGDVSTQKAGILFGQVVIADQRVWRVLG